MKKPTKTIEQLIADYKKSNTLRKERIAALAGFKNGATYLADLGLKLIAKTKPSKKITKSVKKAKPETEMLDYVVAFDTTGSMGSYIADVKAHVESLIPEMFSQGIDLRMKIIAFGDYCDMPHHSAGKGFGYAYQESKFTDDQKELINFVKNARNTGGGDSEEFYELVIQKITKETPWRKGSRRAVLFIADDNPHDAKYYTSSKKQIIDWKEEAKAAAKLNIAFDTLSIHGNRYPWYAELSKITGGICMPFQSSNKMKEVFKASSYVRGSTISKATFTASFAAATASGDEELIGTYKSLSTLL